MLKLSITQGGSFGNKDPKPIISPKDIKGITTLLCEWYEKLPKTIANHVEVIKVAPVKEINTYWRIYFTVIFSGKCSGANNSDLLPQEWKDQIGVVHYLYKPERSINDKSKTEIVNELNERLAQMFCNQIETNRQQFQYFESLLQNLQ